MSQNNQAAGAPAQNSGAVRNKAAKKNVSYLFLALVVGIALLLSAVALYTATSNNDSASSQEASQVNTSEYQAVFLNNGQVYFGKIGKLNSKFVVITDIFYIEAQNTQQQSNNNYTLRKLGTSELHAPEDKMIINRDQVTFWENLKDSGRVVTAIKEYKKNPNGNNQVQNTDSGQTPTANQNTTKKQ